MEYPQSFEYLMRSIFIKSLAPKFHLTSNECLELLKPLYELGSDDDNPFIFARIYVSRNKDTLLMDNIYASHNWRNLRKKVASHPFDLCEWRRPG